MLLKSDGTKDGTVFVKDINSGSNLAFPGNNPNFFVFNNALYFVAYTPANGTEIWKTDGTEAGTVLLRDINVGTGSITTSPYNLHFTILNGFLYFLANDGGGNVQLWRTDGTTAGTTRITNSTNNAALFRLLVSRVVATG